MLETFLRNFKETKRLSKNFGTFAKKFKTICIIFLKYFGIETYRE